uniref:Putative conserved secreted protein n=1 Tax=Ixodes scapularis TaxID=6945 RepID=A0A4D5RBD0_IXOSC
MRTWGIFVLLGACFATLDQASGFGEWTEREQHPAKCTRMFPSSWNWIGKYATHCRYLCRTFPPRYEDEEDKTQCMGFNVFGVCHNGKCVKKEDSPTTPAVFPSSSTSDEAEQPKETVTESEELFTTHETSYSEETSTGAAVEEDIEVTTTQDASTENTDVAEDWPSWDDI